MRSLYIPRIWFPLVHAGLPLRLHLSPSSSSRNTVLDPHKTQTGLSLREKITGEKGIVVFFFSFLSSGQWRGGRPQAVEGLLQRSLPHELELIPARS